MNLTHIQKCGNKNKCRNGLHTFLKKKHKYYTIFPLLIAILPKCPFCILAYSSTLMLCSNTGEISQSSIIHFSLSSLLITLVLCSIILIGIVLNYKGQKTINALLIAFLGILCIGTSLILGGGEFMYYTGTSILFFSVWFNGSFLYFFKKTKEYIRRKENFLLFIKKYFIT